MSVAESLQDEAFLRYLRRVRSSSTVHVEGSISTSAMVTFWHEWMLCVLASVIGRPKIAVYVWEQPGVKRSIRLIERLGFRVIIARPDNAYGVRELREWLRHDQRIAAITLDGPSGPRQVAKPGVVRLARLVKTLLYPLEVSARGVFELGSWDRCVMPDIGSPITARVGPSVPAAVPVTQATEFLQTSLESTPASPQRIRGRSSLRTWAWARLCTMPLEFGKVTLWPDRTQFEARGTESPGPAS